MREFEVFEEYEATGLKLEKKFSPTMHDISRELKLKQAEKDKAELQERVKLLEQQARISQKAEKMAKLELQQSQKDNDLLRKKKDPNSERPNTWAGRGCKHRAWSPSETPQRGRGRFLRVHTDTPKSWAHTEEKDNAFSWYHRILQFKQMEHFNQRNKSDKSRCKLDF